MNKEFLLPDEAAALESFRDYLLDRERAAATISKYMTDARKLLHFLNGEKLLNKERMIAFKEWLWEHYKPASCNSIIAAVNQFLESLGGGDFKIRQFKRQRLMSRPSEKYLTQEEFTRLIKTAQKEKKYRLAAAMATIAMTGARVSELNYFTVECIRYGQVIVKNKGKIRTILLPDTLKKLLLDYARRKRILSGCLFATASGRPLNRSNLWREMQKLQIAANVRKEKLFPHNLRHFFAHSYFELTRDISALGDILGHNNLNVTRIYTMKTAEMQRKTLNMLSNYYIKKGELSVRLNEKKFTT